MRCYDCGHPVHDGQCLECPCLEFGRDPLDDKLRERPGMRRKIVTNLQGEATGEYD